MSDAVARSFPVCRAEELPPGARRIVDIEGKSIGVFNIRGEYFAIRNLCPHQFAPLCLGRITGTTLPGKVGEYHWAREGEIVRCPWHGWEFDIKTGQSVFNPHKLRVKSYKVTVDSLDGTACEQEVSAGDPDPALETYPVTLEGGHVVVHL